MKNKADRRALARLTAMPVAQILLGLILLLFPDGAISLVCRILGWGMAAVGVFLAVLFFTDRNNQSIGMLLAALAVGGCGVFLVRNPLLLAVGTGKILGIVLLLWGVNSLIRTGRNREHSILKYFFGGVTAIAGIWLLLSPMTPSRLILGIIGVWLIGAAVGKLFSMKEEIRKLAEPRTPTIIDADE